jgi:pyruvate kinase
MTDPPPPRAPRRTRIVATVGPASRSPERLSALLSSGVDVFRVNCSHLGPGAIRTEIEGLKQAIRISGRRASILVDLQGPKIRTGPLAAPMELAPGDRLTLVMDPERPGEPGRVGCTWPSLSKDLRVGQTLLFADGELSGEVEEILPGDERRADEVVVRMVDGGRLGAHKGINVPGAALSAESLTPKDLRDLEEAVGADIDCVALSFVRRAADIARLREALRSLGVPHMPICAKIEKPQALEEIHGILEQVDAIMVARGDLGVETPLARIALVQKRLIRDANRVGVLVITATQMLDSMQREPRPTRAEVTDVANAILDGTDAVMLSGETAVGEHPAEAVRVMDRIAREVEASEFLRPPPIEDLPFPSGLEGTIARATCLAARELRRAVAVYTRSGASAIILSKSRPRTPVFALTPEEGTADRLALAWGVTPVRIPETQSVDAMLQAGEAELLRLGLVRPGEEVIFMGGQAPDRAASNFLKVDRIKG